MTRPSPWWRPDALAGRRSALAARAALAAAVRADFAAEGLLEVETPALQVSPGNETHISGFATQAIGNDAVARAMYLHASPEFACKKLLAAGAGDLFTFARVFRNRERGRLHHPEFTMLEWYRVLDTGHSLPRAAGEGDHPQDDGGGCRRFDISPADDDPTTSIREVAAPSTAFGGPPPRLREGGCARRDPGTTALMADVNRILRIAGNIPVDGVLRHREATCEAAAEPEVVTVVEAFRRHAGLDLESMLPDAPDAHAHLAEATRAGGLRVATDDTWSDLFSKILSALVEPKLGHGRPTILTRYPASEAALARLCPDAPRFAERFELFACGVELANAFHELSDAAEQRRRFEAAEAERARIYGDAYPIDEDFLDALAFMPDTCGIALGFDRLVMLATGSDHIEDVLWAPVAELSG